MARRVNSETADAAYNRLCEFRTPPTNTVFQIRLIGGVNGHCGRHMIAVASQPNFTYALGSPAGALSHLAALPG